MVKIKKISKTFSELSAKLLKKSQLHIYIYIYNSEICLLFAVNYFCFFEKISIIMLK